MIHINGDVKTLALKPAAMSRGEWQEKLHCFGALSRTLLIETVGVHNRPICPRCWAFNEPASLPAGAGLCMCWNCVKPFVALRFIGETALELWCSFPWPE